MPAELLQLTVNGLTVGSFYALVALGYTVVYGIVRLINFAHGDLTILSSFVALTFIASMGGIILPTWLQVIGVFAIPMVVAPVLMYVIFRLTYRPMLRRRALLGLMIVALGAALLLQNLMLLIYGPNPRPFPGLLSFGSFSLATVRVSYNQIILFALAVGLMAGMYWFVHRTVVGTAMRALAIDHEAARAIGINVDRLISVAFVAAAVLAAASGVMIGLYYSQIAFTQGFYLGLRAFTAAVLGGIGNIPGAMVGGLLIGLLEAYAGGFISGRWQDVLVFVVLIATLILRPSGILGERIAERV